MTNTPNRVLTPVYVDMERIAAKLYPSIPLRRMPVAAEEVNKGTFLYRFAASINGTEVQDYAHILTDPGGGYTAILTPNGLVPSKTVGHLVDLFADQETLTRHMTALVRLAENTKLDDLPLHVRQQMAPVIEDVKTRIPDLMFQITGRRTHDVVDIREWAINAEMPADLAHAIVGNARLAHDDEIIVDLQVVHPDGKPAVKYKGWWNVTLDTLAKLPYSRLEHVEAEYDSAQSSPKN